MLNYSCKTFLFADTTWTSSVLKLWQATGADEGPELN